MQKRNLYFAVSVGVVVILLLAITNTRPRVHTSNPKPTFKTSDGDVLLSEEEKEVQKILDRVDTCLEATNVTQDFKRAGYDVAARDNAEQFIKMLRTIIPRNFSSKYSSPCWETDFQVSLKNTGLVESKVGNTTFLSKPTIYQYAENFLDLKNTHKGTFKSNIVCLPKVFQMGVPKCGTTFLHCLMTRGLGMDPAQLRKELRWWERWPKPIQRMPQPDNIPVYLLHYAKAYKMITQGNHDVVTLDGSPNYLYPNSLTYFKSGPPVNYCLLPAIIPEVLPDSKFVITLRNPVEMLYSWFLYSCGKNVMVNRSPDIFHERIMIKLKEFDKCIKHHSLDWCALNITHSIYSHELPCGRTEIAVAMYYIHIRRWLSVTPRERFLFLTMKEVSKNTEEVGKKLWKFMGYPGEFKGVSVSPCQGNYNRNKYWKDPQLKIRSDTEQILKDFFRPYNQMLADLLGGKKFLWEDS